MNKFQYPIAGHMHSYIGYAMLEEYRTPFQYPIAGHMHSYVVVPEDVVIRIEFQYPIAGHMHSYGSGIRARRGRVGFNTL